MSIDFADISEFQINFNAEQYARYFPDVVSIRAHNGFRVDNYWSAHRDAARAHIHHPGWYQYLTRWRDAADQAHDFLQTLGTVRAGEWVMLDAESGDFLNDGTDLGRAETWLAIVSKALPGTPVVVYSEGSSFEGVLAGINNKWPKIIASVLTGTAANAPEWLRPAMANVGWQYSWAHPTAGIDAPCDANDFNGTLAEWEKAMGFKAAPVHHKPKPPHVPNPIHFGVQAYALGQGGHGPIGIGVAALQNALHYVIDAPLVPSNPPVFGLKTQQAVHDFQVLEHLIPCERPARGCSAGLKTITKLNQMIDAKKN